MRHIIFLIFLSVAQYQSTAQKIVSAELQAAGLTCSMCSNAIQKSLQTLPFVEAVEPDLKRSAFLIQFRDLQNIVIQSIRHRVEDAGFSVASLTLSIDREGKSLPLAVPVQMGKQYFCVSDATQREHAGTYDVLVIHKSFLTEKKWKQFQKIMPSSCELAGREPLQGLYLVTPLQ